MTAWQLDASCRGKSPFFDAFIDGESERARKERHAAAIRICWQCPVRVQCAEFRDPLLDFEVMAGHPAPGVKNVPATGKYRLSDEAARREVLEGTVGDTDQTLGQVRRDVVVELTAQGWSAKQIADRLKITMRAVTRHRQEARRGVA